MAFNSLVLTRYVADSGTLYTVRQRDGIRAALGNTLADGTETGRLPQALRPRKIHAAWFSAGGVGQAIGKFTRSEVIGSASNALYTNATKTVSLPDYDSLGTVQTTPNVMRSFTVTGRTGESQTFT
jgi:hypothetical protein